ncbi:Homoserine kinase [Penicillium coprophilum]|uniref:Homoserine kinase n=1 Tax=Penicillium coprophilum TaxID=36646 RepID=UPI00239F8783|nr:Homoserine kinase [Penicillium coprophilum]KAJ5150497.1 Homoserine kinase [Penicillium coprophilum]
MTSFVIKIPCSSANIGPGFDVIGLALSLYLDLHVTVEAKPSSQLPFNCAITYEDQSKSVEQISLDPEVNLITRVALYVLRCHDQRAFPVETKVHIVNPIPLGRGLGSSGTAVVAGVMLGNEVERHPDNVAASLFGGFVGTYLNELKPEDVARKEIPLSETPEPPMAIGHYRKFNWAPEIKAIAIIPNFVVPTANARNVLPETYSRADVVFNLQRAALLPAALGSSPPDPDMIFLAMQDKVHQPYRKTLIPGLTEILQFMTPATQPGLLGICLSGAGPTILALATDRFTEIADRIIAQFASNDISCQWKLLEPAQDGATVTYN